MAPNALVRGKGRHRPSGGASRGAGLHPGRCHPQREGFRSQLQPQGFSAPTLCVQGCPPHHARHTPGLGRDRSAEERSPHSERNQRLHFLLARTVRRSLEGAPARPSAGWRRRVTACPRAPGSRQAPRAREAATVCGRGGGTRRGRVVSEGVQNQTRCETTSVRARQKHPRAKRDAWLWAPGPPGDGPRSFHFILSRRPCLLQARKILRPAWRPNNDTGGKREGEASSFAESITRPTEQTDSPPGT